MKKPVWIWGSTGGVLAAGLIATAALVPGARGGAHGAVATRKREASAGLRYPPASGQLPPGLKIDYSQPSNRTTMTLEIIPRDIEVPRDYSLTHPRMRLISDFEGPTRRPGVGELSVRVKISADSSLQGALAPSLPIVEFQADGNELDARSPPPGVLPYKSESKAGRHHETLECRLATKDLVVIATSRSVSVHCGVATFRLSPSQIAALREFAARMNPNIR